ncbi:MAG: RdgB/HAM1 family non-canonical purine NTP pyrophosphatase [Candidatus Aminicenantes bacterium]|jgi:XTP/dITP diphosphohydrolase
MFELLAATKNRGKLREIEKLFTGGSFRVKLYFLPDFNITVDCPETGETFIENAIQKSLFYGKLVPDIYTVGDDSGLAVEALNGGPGIYSSRYSGPGATDEKNIVKLLEQLKNINNRKAKFVTAVCLSRNGQVIQTFTGEVEGIIIDEKRGSGGFGYDPLFYYPQFKKTFAELTTEEKNRISHRARAFHKLRDFLENLG